MSLGNYDPREQEERSKPDVLALHQAAIREMGDPRDGFAPTPVWLLFFSSGWRPGAVLISLRITAVGEPMFTMTSPPHPGRAPRRWKRNSLRWPSARVLLIAARNAIKATL